MKIRLRGVNTVRKRLADGSVRIHYYHRATGLKLPSDPESAEFVGRLTELNRPDLIDRIDPRSIEALIISYKASPEFKQLAPGPVQSSFYYHHARLIDILYGIEKIEQILSDPLILDKHVRATAGVNRLEGAGQAEAPRGTLMHNYKVDENGLITWANLVIATGQNNNAMNKGVLQAAKAYVKDGKFTEGTLNRVEAVIRTFDPCLSCSTHAFGQMPLALTLLSAEGEVVDQLIR